MAAAEKCRGGRSETGCAETTGWLDDGFKGARQGACRDDVQLEGTIGRDLADGDNT
jgi:hypothetical protein